MACLFSSPISDSKVNSEDHPFSRTDVTVTEFLLEDYYKKFLKLMISWDEISKAKRYFRIIIEIISLSEHVSEVAMILKDSIANVR